MVRITMTICATLTTTISVSLALIIFMSILSGLVWTSANRKYRHANAPILVIVRPSIIQKIEMICLALAVLSLSRPIEMTLDGENKKMAGSSHRTATTTYPCCLPALGRFSRSWSCKTCRGKDKGMKAVGLFESLMF